MLTSYREWYLLVRLVFGMVNVLWTTSMSPQRLPVQAHTGDETKNTAQSHCGSVSRAALALVNNLPQFHAFDMIGWLS